MNDYSKKLGEMFGGLGNYAYFCGVINKGRTNMNTIISKEEALRRLVATKESKRQRIAVLKERMKEKYVNSMGVEPENILFL